MKKTLRSLLCILTAAVAVFIYGCGGEPQQTDEETTGIITAEITDAVTDAASDEATEQDTEPVPEEDPEWDGPHVKNIKIAGVDISEYTVVKSGSDRTVGNAYNDFLRYIEYATELELKRGGDVKSEHEICIGETDRDTELVRAEREKLVNDGYAIIYDGGRLYITGKTPTGTMYGVYTFLEDYAGCRFLSSKCKYYKYIECSEVPADICRTFSPKLINRDVYWYDAASPSFASKIKINGGVNRNMVSAGDGTDIKYAGHFVHSLPYLAGTSTAPNDQPCLTDPAVYEKVLKNVRQLLRENPEAKIISVSQNDSYADGLGCQCENCRKLDNEQGTPMGSLLTFVNRIANDIKDEFPDVYVDTLAYRYTRKAPKTLKPADNVIIRLCSIECCFTHPLNDPDCEANRAFCEDIEAWSKICDNLFIWDYTTDFMYYLNPFPNLGVLYDNIRFFVDHNVIGLFEQGNGQSVSGEFGELRAYLLAKMMWDPDMTREQYYEHMDDFLKGYYGAGWRYIREYIDRTTEKAKEGHMGIYDPITKAFVFKGAKRQSELTKFLTEMEELWSKAYEAADDDLKDNVLRSSMQVKAAQLYTKWSKTSSPEKLQELHELMKKYRITFFRENARVPDNVDYTKRIDLW